MGNKTCGDCKHFYDYENRTWPCCWATPTDDACAEFEGKVITNGDKIRQMRNEELAELFALSFMCDACPLKDVECVGDGETARTYAHCYDKFNSWLNAPADCVGKDNNVPTTESEGGR